MKIWGYLKFLFLSVTYYDCNLSDALCHPRYVCHAQQIILIEQETLTDSVLFNLTDQVPDLKKELYNVKKKPWGTAHPSFLDIIGASIAGTKLILYRVEGNGSH